MLREKEKDKVVTCDEQAGVGSSSSSEEKHYPSDHHLSDRQHFMHSGNPNEHARGLGAYPPKFSAEWYRQARQHSPGLFDDD